MYQYNAVIVDVVDGDTVVIDIDLGFAIHHVHKLRVAKYDAPELSTELGVKAKQRAVELLQGAKVVISTKKTFSDKYGRYLCSILLADGVTDFATQMIKENFIKPRN